MDAPPRRARGVVRPGASPRTGHAPDGRSAKTTFAFAVALILAAAAPLSGQRAPRAAAARGTEERPPVQPSPVRYEIRFNDDLHVSRGLELSGNRSAGSVVFHLESSWTPIEGSALHLFIETSPDLDEERSFLSVSLNYGIVRSFRLDSVDRRQREMVIPLPPEMLDRTNELVFSIQQFARSDHRSPQVWTRIKENSLIRIRYQPGAPRLDLSDLPAPLLEPHSYRQQRLAVLLPKSPSTETLEAAALAVAHLSSRIAPQSVLIRPVSSARAAGEPLLIVGTPDEQPGLHDLQGSSFMLRTPDRRMVIVSSNGEALTEREGLVGLTTRPRDDLNPVLFVTGNAPAGVLAAARAVFRARLHAGTAMATFSGDVHHSPSARRHWRGFIPPRNHFMLGDLGFGAARIRPGPSILIPLDAPPDARFLRYGHQMRLLFELPPGPLDEQAYLTVALNDTILGRFSVSQLGRRSRPSVRLDVPSGLLVSRNRLTLQWEGGWRDADQDFGGWLLPTSEFYLPRNYRADIPDLGLLQFHLYPFSLTADLSDTVIVLPEVLDVDLMSAVLEFAGVLGRLLPTNHPAFTVRRMGELTARQRLDFNLIFLWVNADGDAGAIFDRRHENLPADVEALPAIHHRVSPWNAERYILGITASTGPALRDAIRQWFSNEILTQLTGDTAYLASPEPILLQLGPTRRVQERFYLTYVEAWLRAHWIALPTILILASGLLFVGLRLLLNHHRGAA